MELCNVKLSYFSAMLYNIIMSVENTKCYSLRILLSVERVRCIFSYDPLMGIEYILVYVCMVS